MCKCGHPKSQHWGYGTKSACRAMAAPGQGILCKCMDYQHYQSPFCQPVSEGEK